MKASRFNWVSRHVASGRRLLVNPLSGSADLLDADGDGLLLTGQDVGALDSEDAQAMVARGYLQAVPERDDELLDHLRAWEEEHFVPAVALHLGVNGTGQAPDLVALARSVEDRLVQRRPGVPAEVVLLARSIAPPPPSPDDLAVFAMKCRALGAGVTVVVTPSLLPLFDAVLAGRLADSVVFSARVEPGEDPATFARRLEIPLDELVYRRLPVTLELEVEAHTIAMLPALANEMIRRGWPIQENFHCRLMPAGGFGCDFGMVYPADVSLARRVLATFAAHPQTQFLHVEGWIGLRTLHELIWHGRMPAPSLHFCAVSRGLGVLTADGALQPCPRLAEVGAQESLRPFQCPQNEWLIGCARCRFLPACGGGCRLAAGGGAPVCPPAGELLEAATEAWLPELLAKADCAERREAPAP